MKRKASKLYRRNKNLKNWDSLRILRNNCTRLRRKAIREYWSNQSNSLKANPRNFYKTFIPFWGSGKSKSNCLIDPSVIIDNTICNDSALISEHLCSYFATVADDIGDPTALSVGNFDSHQSIKYIENNWDKNKRRHSNVS